MFLGAFGTPLAVYVWQNLVSPKFQKQNRRDSFEGTLGEGRSKKSALSTHVLGPLRHAAGGLCLTKFGQSKIPKAKPQG
jgi:hypothetical protein